MKQKLVRKSARFQRSIMYSFSPSYNKVNRSIMYSFSPSYNKVDMSIMYLISPSQKFLIFIIFSHSANYTRILLSALLSY